MPLKATEKAALAATPAASTFQRWRGVNEEEMEEEGEWVILPGSFRFAKVFENQKIIGESS